MRKDLLSGGKISVFLCGGALGRVTFLSCQRNSFAGYDRAENPCTQRGRQNSDKNRAFFKRQKEKKVCKKLQGLPKRYADKKVPQKTSENDSEKRRAEKKVGKNPSSLNEAP